MRTPHYEHDSRIIEPRKCGKDRVRERPDQDNRIERFLHLGRQIIRVGVLPLQFFPQLGPRSPADTGDSLNLMASRCIVWCELC